MSALAFKRFF